MRHESVSACQGGKRHREVKTTLIEEEPARCESVPACQRGKRHREVKTILIGEIRRKIDGYEKETDCLLRGFQYLRL